MAKAVLEDKGALVVAQITGSSAIKMANPLAVEGHGILHRDRLRHPDGYGSMFDAVELIVPHQANKAMVTSIAEAAGLDASRLYFDIDRIGNTSSASIPLALQDAVRDGVLTRPT